MSSYLWIDQAPLWAQHAKSLCQASALALDTEFVRTDTFYPHLGLIQLASDDQVLLVDALVPDCLSGVDQSLLSGDVQPLWVLHSCAEDLEVIFNQWGRLPQRVADTQLAAAFLGHSRQMSLQNLLATELGVHLTKDETRSNWCQRPLSNAQLAYAAEDVRYLLPLWERLASALRASERMDWFEEDSAKLLAKAARQTPYEQMYLQFHDAWQLKDKPLSVLKALVIWREIKARQLNRPRGFIVKDPVLFSIAEKLPKNAAALAAIPNIIPSTVRRFSDELLQIVADTEAESGLPRPSKPLTNVQRQTLKQIKIWLDQQAERFNMPVELLAGRRVLEHLIRQGAGSEAVAPEEWRGWRQAMLEAGIIEIMQNGTDQ